MALLVITGLYIFLILVFALFFNFNLKFWRSPEYTIPFGLAEGNQRRGELTDPKVVYWVCENPEQEDPDDWAVLLHSFGRNSARMVQRAEIYWERGYSLIFVDARGHGQSQRLCRSNGFTYAEDVTRVLEYEGIKEPIIHGLSVGAIAGSIYSYQHPVRAFVGEALVNNYRDMVYDSIRELGLPLFTLKWVADLLLSLDLPFDEYSPDHTLPLIDAPIFLIHGERDTWFPPDTHLLRNVENLRGRRVEYWLVPGSSHSKMAQHPDYRRRLTEFLDTHVRSRIKVSH